MIANVSNITTIVSVQMLEATHATLTDAILRDALKTVSVRKEVPEANGSRCYPTSSAIWQLSYHPVRPRRRRDPDRRAE